MATLYASGKGVDKNPKTAFFWFLKSANQGTVDAMYFVGKYYRDGTGTEEDLGKAYQWMKLSILNSSLGSDIDLV